MGEEEESQEVEHLRHWLLILLTQSDPENGFQGGVPDRLFWPHKGPAYWGSALGTPFPHGCFSAASGRFSGSQDPRPGCRTRMRAQLKARTEERRVEFRAAHADALAAVTAHAGYPPGAVPPPARLRIEQAARSLAMVTLLWAEAERDGPVNRQAREVRPVTRELERWQTASWPPSGRRPRGTGSRGRSTRGWRGSKRRKARIPVMTT